MTRNQQVFVLAVAMLASWSQAASAGTATVTVSTTANLNTGSNLISFGNIANADQLVSISGGSINNGEGGTFNLLVNYQGGSSSTIYTTPISPGVPLNFNTLTSLNFTAGTINGLTFSLPGFSNGSLPSGTVFTFHTADAVGSVPEPASWAMMIAGFGLMGLAFRRRRVRQSISDTNSAYLPDAARLISST